MSPMPKYLIRTIDDIQYGYWNPDLLLFDLGRDRHAVAGIYELAEGLRVVYTPITENQLREKLGFKPKENL